MLEFTLNRFEIDERVDDIVCKLVWLPLIFLDDTRIVGGDDDIWSSCNDIVELLEEFFLRIESIRLMFTNCGWSLFVCSSISGMIDLVSCRGRNNVEK